MKPKLDLIGIPKKILKNLRIKRKRRKMLRMKSWSILKRKMKRTRKKKVKRMKKNRKTNQVSFPSQHC